MSILYESSEVIQKMSGNMNFLAKLPRVLCLQNTTADVFYSIYPVSKSHKISVLSMFESEIITDGQRYKLSLNSVNKVDSSLVGPKCLLFREKMSTLNTAAEDMILS